MRSSIKKRLGSKQQVLIIVLIGLLVLGSGFAVWWQEREPSTMDGAEGVTEQTGADDYIEFTNQEPGFAFAYPPEWGEVRPDHLTAYNPEGQSTGPFYRWRFSNRPNIYLFAPRRDGRIAVQRPEGTTYTSGYSYGFTKLDGNAYCVNYTYTRSPRCLSLGNDIHLLEDYEFNGVPSLIWHYDETYDAPLDQAFFAPNQFLEQLQDGTTYNVVEILSILDRQGLYPSATIQIIDRQNANFSSDLKQLRAIVRSMRKL